jgi:hypothetical protein
MKGPVMSGCKLRQSGRGIALEEKGKKGPLGSYNSITS